MFIETVRIESLSNNGYVVGSEQSGRCVVIDPARDVDRYVQIAANHGTRIVYAFETHVHNDFVSGARELADQTGCQVGASASGGLLFPSVRLQENDDFDLGEFTVRVIHTPGHTQGSVSFYTEGMLFSGDTLFRGSIGRTDLPGGNYEQEMASIVDRLLALPDDTIVRPGHMEQTTIGEERHTNPFVLEELSRRREA